MKVSGHWTIEVREPDGSLVSRQEFENALQSIGRESLAQFLARDKTPGLWRVYLGVSISPTSPCLDTSTGSAVVCVVAESGDVTGSNVFRNLAVSLNSASVVRLSGTATAQRDGEVGVVATTVFRCANTIAPSSPCSSGLGTFTQKTLTTPVPVLLNQQVVVTVDISFN